MIFNRLRYVGICGIISLLSYLAMLIFSPLAFPGYNWLTMAVSELSASDAPSLALATQLNSLFGPCGVVSIMAVAIAVCVCKSRCLKIGVYLFAGMEWICNVGYTMFPWASTQSTSSFQNVMHIVVTVLVVVLSIAGMVLIAIGAKKEKLNKLFISTIVCLSFMFIGAMGTNAFPKLLGLFERFSTLSTVVYNAILGIWLIIGIEPKISENNEKVLA